MNNKINETFETSQKGSAVKEIDIIQIIILMLRNWWIIVLVGLILGIACFAYSKSVSVPSYLSEGRLYIVTQREQINSDINAQAISDARDLMPTYAQILKSRSFNTVISDAMDNKYSYEQIAKMVSYSQIEDTNIMNVSVRCVDEVDSYLICNHIMSLASDEILRVFEGGSVKIIDSPKHTPEVVVVNIYRRGAIGFIIGAVLVMFIIIIFNLFDNRITTTEELTSRYKFPVLGEIPNLSDEP